MQIPAPIQHTKTLECFKTLFVPFWKSVAWGNFWDYPTMTSFIVMWQFWTILSASLFWITSDVHPLSPLFSRIYPSTFLVSAFLAHAIRRSLFPFPIHLLIPLILYPSGTFATTVSRLEASDPILSSVSPQPPIFYKDIIWGKYFFFCS